MKLDAWYKKRGLSFILERARRLNERYSFSPRKSIDRIKRCMEVLRGFDCYPTFAVPGMVVEHNSTFIRCLQESGAEIAVHGYNHVDLQGYPPEEASIQLKHAAQVLRENGLEVHGFRCPYLSATDDLLKAIPPDLFEYSSNKAIQWPTGLSSDLPEGLLFETLKGFYAPVKSEKTLSLPWYQDGLVEVPVCVPDDLQLHDGLGYGLEQISQFWLDILHETHQRGELFSLMFHPELASFCEVPFIMVLQEAHLLEPYVWLARLCDISAWWKEKAGFHVEAEPSDGGYYLKFNCSTRATILSRGLELPAQNIGWDKTYQLLDTWLLRIEGSTLPFIGLPSDAPSWIISALSSAGYIIDTSETASQCSIYLDPTCLTHFQDQIGLIGEIECSPKPLIRFWPWPDGARSAMCITGDLDALSFFDYTIRLFNR